MSKKYIKNFFYRDEKALMSISRCGYVSHNNLKEYIAEKRITNYLRDGLVTKEVFSKNNGEQLVGYKLTAEGRKFVEREYGFKDHQIAQSINHDLGIAKVYFSLSQEERDTWKTETQIREEFQGRLEEIKSKDYDRFEEINKLIEERQISVVDCSYVDKETGIENYVEIFTNSYGQVEFESKERFVEIMSIKSYITERV
ncbi:TPA: hypothetical protein JD074_04325 [Clostridioides difficile]|uniref:hypothetical protein n=1 Tax=Clostridioides difficile TaxID=1496 RepID=UPI0009442256|nr:hypothetical protein [Clostridioides difficile]MBJ9768425.1 hypothetical protein [Clostridioides difficile]MDV9805241.1 hypothetical protein [Clostridioides difficile]MDV9896278.1 hypothetical protein [Clostridioides difficile]MDV9911308.1 hypothetical protein [Clostridioides difficile]VFE46370.1 Uncharacterised protein [Clostridioides difficile]